MNAFEHLNFMVRLSPTLLVTCLLSAGIINATDFDFVVPSNPSEQQQRIPFGDWTEGFPVFTENEISEEFSSIQLMPKARTSVNTSTATVRIKHAHDIDSLVHKSQDTANFVCDEDGRLAIALPPLPLHQFDNQGFYTFDHGQDLRIESLVLIEVVEEEEKSISLSFYNKEGQRQTSPEFAADLEKVFLSNYEQQDPLSKLTPDLGIVFRSSGVIPPRIKGIKFRDKKTGYTIYQDSHIFASHLPENRVFIAGELNILRETALEFSISIRERVGNPIDLPVTLSSAHVESGMGLKIHAVSEGLGRSILKKAPSPFLAVSVIESFDLEEFTYEIDREKLESSTVIYSAIACVPGAYTLQLIDQDNEVVNEEIIENRKPVYIFTQSTPVNHLKSLRMIRYGEPLELAGEIHPLRYHKELNADVRDNMKLIVPKFRFVSADRTTGFLVDHLQVDWNLHPGEYATDDNTVYRGLPISVILKMHLERIKIDDGIQLTWDPSERKVTVLNN